LLILLCWIFAIPAAIAMAYGCLKHPSAFFALLVFSTFEG